MQPQGGVLTQPLLDSLPQNNYDYISASGAVDPGKSGTYIITKAGVAALTLGAPSKDGLTITLVSATANQHTLTATNILLDGNNHDDVGTFSAYPGASMTIISYNGKWYVVSSNQVTFT